jgi:Protein of unknown function (DUF2877)
MKILSMGDQVLPGTYTVKEEFEHSVLLLDSDESALFVVDRSIGEGPLNLLVTDPQTFLEGTSLEIPRLLKAPMFDSAMPRLEREERIHLRKMLEKNLPKKATSDSLISLFFPVKSMSRLQQARDTIFNHAFRHFEAKRLAEGVRLIRGCGSGLTPAGDDFLCGLMLACRLRRNWAMAQTILRHALGQNPISNAFLDLSAKGRVNIVLQKFITAPTPARMAKVCDFGHSSGADLLCGLRHGLEWDK